MPSCNAKTNVSEVRSLSSRAVMVTIAVPEVGTVTVPMMSVAGGTGGSRLTGPPAVKSSGKSTPVMLTRTGKGALGGGVAVMVRVEPCRS